MKKSSYNIFYECPNCNTLHRLRDYVKIPFYWNSRKWGFEYKCMNCWYKAQKSYYKKYALRTYKKMVLVE